MRLQLLYHKVKFLYSNDWLNCYGKNRADSASPLGALSMELGGNAPFIVFDDADLYAIDLAVAIKYGIQVRCGMQIVFLFMKIFMMNL